MKHLISILLTFCALFNANAQSASELCESGRKAFVIGNFEEAKAYLTKAANMGEAKACGLLGLGYMSGCFESGRDLRSALQWATKGYSNSMLNPEPTCMGVLGMLGTATAESKKDWIENLPFLEHAYSHGFSPSNIGNLISVCYLLKGDKEKASEWAKKIQDIEKDEEDKDQYYMASAILSKIYLDKKDYSNALATARDAAVEGNPIAQYVMGRCQIKMDIFPEVGKRRVREAALYEYSPLVDINAFDEEIQKYYNSIKDKKF
jgi:hypothetical protein